MEEQITLEIIKERILSDKPNKITKKEALDLWCLLEGRNIRFDWDNKELIIDGLNIKFYII